MVLDECRARVASGRAYQVFAALALQVVACGASSAYPAGSGPAAASASVAPDAGARTQDVTAEERPLALSAPAATGSAPLPAAVPEVAASTPTTAGCRSYGCC